MNEADKELMRLRDRRRAAMRRVDDCEQAAFEAAKVRDEAQFALKRAIEESNQAAADLLAHVDGKPE